MWRTTQQASKQIPWGQIADLSLLVKNDMLHTQAPGCIQEPTFPGPNDGGLCVESLRKVSGEGSDYSCFRHYTPATAVTRRQEMTFTAWLRSGLWQSVGRWSFKLRTSEIHHSWLRYRQACLIKGEPVSFHNPIFLLSCISSWNQDHQSTLS